MEIFTRAEFAEECKFVSAGGGPSARAIAQLLRRASARWGLCPRRVLLKYAREELAVARMAAESVPDVLDRLVALGEMAEVTVGDDRFVVPTEPRWIDVGEGRATLIGTVTLPVGLESIPELGQDDIIRRVAIQTEEQTVQLEAAGLRRITLREWLHPCAYLRHIARRVDATVRSDQWSLAGYWEWLVALVAEEGLLLGPDAEFRALAGPPGAYFGHYNTPDTEGRWTQQPTDGVWCAYRRGYGPDHWLPMLVAVDGDNRRALDLFDADEWRWALLARAKALGVDEVVQRIGGEERVTWPLPLQLRAAMELIGTPSEPWRWRLAENAPDLWALLE